MATKRKPKKVNTKKRGQPPPDRVFYRWPPSFDFLWTAPSLVFCVLAFFPIALIYTVLSHS